MNPAEIEKRSMEIIESELTIPLPEDIKPIVKRVIHATADFTFAKTLVFSPGVIPLMRGMLESGASIVTDTNMALAGISKPAIKKLNVEAMCFMAEEDVAAEAKLRGETRATISMERALSLSGPKLLVCGNAPTFLFPLLDKSPLPQNIAVIGVPVGFVNVVETKERLWKSGIPCIAAMGRRGGSTVAAAIVNALLYGIPGVRS